MRIPKECGLGDAAGDGGDDVAQGKTLLVGVLHLEEGTEGAAPDGGHGAVGGHEDERIVAGGDDLNLSEQDDGHVHAADHEELPEGAEDGHDEQDADATHVSKTKEGIGDEAADLVAERARTMKAMGLVTIMVQNGVKTVESTSGMTFLKNFSTK